MGDLINLEAGASQDTDEHTGTRWHYAKGKPKEEVQAAQDMVVTWQRPDSDTKEPQDCVEPFSIHTPT